MARLGISTLLTVALGLSVGFWTGCGGDSSPEVKASDDALAEASAAGSSQAEAELERRDKSLDAFQETLDALRERGFAVGHQPDTRFKASEGRARLEDRASARQFTKTPVDRALAELPQRKPPLHVLQWVEQDLGNDLVHASKTERERFYGMSPEARLEFLTPKVSHKVYARVDRKRWYGMTRHARAAAVKAFYRDADKAFRRKGIRDFVLVVAPLNATTEHLPALAIGRDGSASLTPLGRGRPRTRL